MNKTKLTINRTRFTALLLVLTMLAGLLAGCGGKSGNAAFSEKQTPKSGAIQVSTMDEFMKAIEPGAVIFLKNGTYNFQKWFETIDVNEWNEVNDFVHFEFESSSYQAEITGIDGLTISGESTSGVKLINEDPYADVLYFTDCHNISVDHMTMGHDAEKGNCTGDVFEFYNCTNVSVDTMDLYGCGTYGINANYTHGLNVTGTTIRECSYGIMSIGNSSDVNFKNCELKDCTGYYQLETWNAELSFEACSFDGNGNGEDCEFFTDDYNQSIYFKGCSFGKWETEQINAYGTPVGLIFDENCKFNGTVARKPVIAKSVEELINAIEDGAMRILEPGYYNISEYIEDLDMSAFNSSHDKVQLMDYFDGKGIVISNGYNISITGRTGKAKDTTIVVEPRYSHCFDMESCAGIAFRGLTVGHTETGECDGAVMQLQSSTGAMFADCDLYGCGTVGIQSYQSSDIYVLNTLIHDCSNSSFVLYECSGVFSGLNSTFDGNGCAINDSLDMSIAFDRCKFGEWESNTLYFNDNIETYDCEWHEITYYPDYSDDGYFGDFRDQLQAQRFDGYVIMGAWQGIQYYDSSQYLDLSLPTVDENGNPYYLNLYIYDDGTGDLFNANTDPLKFDWYMDSDYSAAIKVDGEVIGSMGVYAAPEEEADVPIFLMMYLQGISVWFEPMTD